jgi:hypothetical protein
MAILAKTDLPSAAQSNELVDAMVAGANAKAARVAPCLSSNDPAPAEDQVAEAKLILIGAVKRWVEAGSGALQSQTAGPFGVTVDTRQRGGFNLWPSEIEQLQAICKDVNAGKAYAIDTAPSLGGPHLPWCALNFGATYCSCGADIAGEPIYELG